MVEAHFTQKPSMAVKIFIIVISLAVGLLILSALIWCLWKVNYHYYFSLFQCNTVCWQCNLQNGHSLLQYDEVKLLYGTKHSSTSQFNDGTNCCRGDTSFLFLTVSLSVSQAGFFKRDLKKKEEEFRRHSWDYVPKSSDRESFS